MNKKWLFVIFMYLSIFTTEILHSCHCWDVLLVFIGCKTNTSSDTTNNRDNNQDDDLIRRIYPSSNRSHSFHENDSTCTNNSTTYIFPNNIPSGLEDI